MNNKEKIDGVTPPKDLDEGLTCAFPNTSIGSNMYAQTATEAIKASGEVPLGYLPYKDKKSIRMEIALFAMQALLAKDFKNIGFSAFNNSKQNPAQYIADQSFILADAMIERENKKEVESDE